MSRRSIDTRMDRIMDRLLPHGSQERREYFLTPQMKAALQYHQTRCAEINRRLEKQFDGPAGAYEAILNDHPDAQMPPMPAALRDALSLPEMPDLTGMTAEGISDCYRRIAEGADR